MSLGFHLTEPHKFSQIDPVWLSRHGLNVAKIADDAYRVDNGESRLLLCGRVTSDDGIYIVFRFNGGGTIEGYRDIMVKLATYFDCRIYHDPDYLEEGEEPSPNRLHFDPVRHNLTAVLT